MSLWVVAFYAFTGGVVVGGLTVLYLTWSAQQPEPLEELDDSYRSLSSQIQSQVQQQGRVP